MLPEYNKYVFYIQILLKKILNQLQHIYMCQFSASQHFINHLQDKYQKYMSYIIKYLWIKFISECNFSNLNIYQCQNICSQQCFGKK